ncbi:MAG: peptidoglycan DD-metalloendopeptidase family protein [Magnetovibrio sp.]|nr:peptidoglycan DD-metalloendopeptidase family protein [Magnetovibrio sp.]
MRTKGNTPRTILGVVAAALLLGALPAWAQSAKNPDAKLKNVEQKIKSQQQERDRQKARAAKLKQELRDVSKLLVAAAKRVHDQESSVASLEAELNRLESIARQKEVLLRERRRQFSGVMMALVRIARFPTEALIAQPISPEDTVRSAILLRAAVPTIEKRADSLKSELQELAVARLKADDQRQMLQGAAESLREDELRIETIRKQKAALRAEAISKSRAAQSKARQLAKQAKSLRDLVDKLNKARLEAEKKAKLEAARKKAQRIARQKANSALHVKPNDQTSANITVNLEPAPDLSALGGIASISKARGKLPFPAVGRVAGLYGQKLEGGLTSKGISIETRLNARVIAPFDGKVVFSGPFRGYGELLIIDHGEGYHSLLAGLGRIDAVIGQPVLAGEPVALMTSDGNQPVLYVEFRRDNQPINPLPWLARRKSLPQG